MPQISISAATIRSWATHRGISIGDRGKISQQVLDQYVHWHEMPLLARIAVLERDVAELRAQHSEDQAVIRAQQNRIASLEREKGDLLDQVEDWKTVAENLALIQHSED